MAFDSLIYGILTHWKTKYHVVRWLFEGLFLISGWALGGTVGIGTLILFVFTGPLVELFLGLLSKLFTAMNIQY